ncbi:hypothetical protein IWQ61_004185 [Dispira simplex]|nr:hypothetical protein IWQ61_004185 [Dispira simplex]
MKLRVDGVPVLQVLLSIGGWYLFSSLLSVLNKRLFGQDFYHFDYPLFVTTIHAGVQWLVSALLVHIWGHKWLSELQHQQLQKSLAGRQWWMSIVPCGAASGLEIALANGALIFITLSFYTMVKSSTPIWVLVFAFMFGLEQFTWPLLLQIFLICFGVALTVVGETQFHLGGFLLVLGASITSGFRWSLTQILLQKRSLGLDHPILTLYRLAPVSFVTMAALTLCLENPWVHESPPTPTLWTFQIPATLGLTVLGGFLALATIMCEFRLIQLTSTVTLSVCGISKEILMITLSILLFGDEMTVVNVTGLVISITGILYYNLDKWRKGPQVPSSPSYTLASPRSSGSYVELSLQ